MKAREFTREERRIIHLFFVFLGFVGAMAFDAGFWMVIFVMLLSYIGGVILVVAVAGEAP